MMIQMRMEATKETMEKLKRKEGRRKDGGRRGGREEEKHHKIEYNNQVFILADVGEVYAHFYIPHSVPVGHFKDEGRPVGFRHQNSSAVSS